MTSFFKLSRKYLGLGLLLSALLLQGCNDTERTVVAGAIIGAAIGVIVSSPGPTCHGGYVNRCSEYRDYRGYRRRDCRETYDSCARTYAQRIDLDLQLGDSSPQVVNKVRFSDETANIASGFKMSFDSAEKLSQSVEALRQGDKAQMLNLGLSDQDLWSVAQGQKLNDDTALKVAQNLNLSMDSVQSLVAQVGSEARVQMSDFNSSYWSDCRASGKWATPENPSCEKAFWKGCSPATGASLCLAQ